MAVAQQLRLQPRAKLTESFDIDGDLARKWLRLPTNPNGRSNSDVIARLWDIDDVTGRPSDRRVVDFGPSMKEQPASLYEAPFEYLRKTIPDQRKDMREERFKKTWWIFQRSRKEMRAAIKPLTRYLVTPETSEHRIFVWTHKTILVVGSLFAIARDDDTTFGILQSGFHEKWATYAGNRLGVGNQRRYNVTVTFETFPFRLRLAGWHFRGRRTRATTCAQPGSIGRIARGFTESRKRGEEIG